MDSSLAKVCFKAQLIRLRVENPVTHCRNVLTHLALLQVRARPQLVQVQDPFRKEPKRNDTKRNETNRSRNVTKRNTTHLNEPPPRTSSRVSLHCTLRELSRTRLHQPQLYQTPLHPPPLFRLAQLHLPFDDDVSWTPATHELKATCRVHNRSVVSARSHALPSKIVTRRSFCANARHSAGQHGAVATRYMIGYVSLSRWI